MLLILIFCVSSWEGTKYICFFFQAEDGIRDGRVTGVQTCALPIWSIRYRIDLDVYRIGSQVWLRHGDLYGVLPLTSSGMRLPFSYPPIAAAALSPLSLMPMAVAGTLLTLASVALTAVVLRVFLRYGAGVGSWWTVG